MKRAARSVAIALLCAAPWRPARAQSASELLTEGIAVYQQLKFDAASQLLARALGTGLVGTLSDAQRLKGLTYLAAAQLFGNHQAGAGATMREILLIDPRYRPDSLLFPPLVRSAFSQVRDSVKVVSVRLPAQATLLVGSDTLPATVYASSLHDIAATLRRGDGTLVRRLYQGPILDSLTLWWDGRDARGARAEPGRYRLTVVSLGPGGAALRSISIPLDIAASRPDTSAYPAQPPDSLFLRERTSAAPGLGSLGIGVLGAGLTVFLPQVVGASGDASGWRFVVSGAVGLAGVLGLIHHGLGHPLPENVTANAARLEAWRRQVRAARQETELHIQAGGPERVEGPSP